MSGILLDRFGLAQEALKTAIGKNLEGAVGYFDKQVDQTYREILVDNPQTPECKMRLTEFLVGYCCDACRGPDAANAAKKRLLELVRQP